MLMDMQPLLSSTLRFLLVTLLILAGFCLFSVVWSVSMDNTTQTAHAASSADSLSSDMATSPNAVSRDMALTLDWLNRSTSSVESAIYNTPRSADIALARSGKLTTDSGRFVVGSVHAATVSTGRFVGRTVGYVFGIPRNIAKSVTHISMASVIRPADSAPMPIIDAQNPTLVPVRAAKPVATTAGQVALPDREGPLPDSPAIWPIHGMITTLFGVPEPPYEPIHTGMDISDGKGVGVTPIHPFRPGRVVEAVHSTVKLGNHIVIDHGGGLTSVYGHLASISVEVGQSVDTNTTIGYEGTTGVSTGPHLHFEIRENGRPVNPQLFIDGRP